MMHGWKAGVTEFDFMGSPVMAMRRTVTMTSLMSELPELLVGHRGRHREPVSHDVQVEMHSGLPRPVPARSACQRLGK